jgi:hypothetical protein
MRLNHRLITLMLCTTVLGSASAVTGCAGYGAVYDPYRHDYHRWTRGEDRLYREWEVGGHHNHMDFKRRSAGEQRAYWSWRHR